MCIFPEGFFTADQIERFRRRTELERDVQNLVGPIANIGALTDATLYGIRDKARGKPTMWDNHGRPIWLIAGSK